MAAYSAACPEDFTSIINHRELITVNMNTPWQTSVKYEAFIYFSTRLRSREAPVTNDVTKISAKKTLIARVLYNLSTDNVVFYVTNAIQIRAVHWLA